MKTEERGKKERSSKREKRFCFFAPVIPDEIDSHTSRGLPLSPFLPFVPPPLHTCPEDE